MTNLMFKFEILKILLFEWRYCHWCYLDFRTIF